MSPFPTDLIPDLLCRLPVKTLLCFKCVSKPWGSIIDDSDFAKLNFHQSLRTNTNVKRFLDNCTENDDMAYSVGFDTLSNLVQFPRPLTAEITRKCHYLPSLDEDITMDHDTLPGYDYDDSTIVGFGCDAISNDYKVVIMLRSKSQISFKVMVYSLKANSWRRIKDCPYEIPTNYNDGAYVNNSIHWVGDEYLSERSLIFALDLGTEQYYEVPEGDGSSNENKCGAYYCTGFRYMNAGVLGGCLCVSRELSTCPVEDHVNLWIMKECGVKESWTELLYLSRNQWLTNVFHTRAASYSRNGDKLLLDEGGDRQPAWFNLEDETGESLHIPGAPQIFFLQRFMLKALFPSIENQLKMLKLIEYIHIIIILKK